MACDPECGEGGQGGNLSDNLQNRHFAKINIGQAALSAREKEEGEGSLLEIFTDRECHPKDLMESLLSPHPRTSAPKELPPPHWPHLPGPQC